MPVTCSAGHQSATADYCDTCGEAIGGAGAPAAAVDPGPSAKPGQAKPDPPAVESKGSPPAAEAKPGPVPPGTTCPECGSARGPDDAFCEVCGLDFATGARPAPPPPPVAAAVSTDTGWSAVVTVDPEFYATQQTDDPARAVALPTGVTSREIPLTADEVHIGRGEDSHGIRPEIDLSLAPGDPGVSHHHAVLARRGDAWVVIDQGSTNGTRVGSATSAPIAPQTEVRLSNGDHLLMGVWTRITLQNEAS